MNHDIFNSNFQRQAFFCSSGREGKEKKKKRVGSSHARPPRLASPLTLVSNCAQSLSYFGSLSAYVAMEFISDAKAL